MYQDLRCRLELHDQTDDGTRSVFVHPYGLCFAIEPPERDNAVGLSCIPAGHYEVVWHKSPRYGWVYHVTDVPERSHILIHPGNFGGDVNLGLKTNTQGCILLGSRLGELMVNGNRQRCVLTSRGTVRGFFRSMQRQPFTLEVYRA